MRGFFICLRKEKCKIMLKILPFIFIIPGFFTVFLAKMIVAKYNLEAKQKANFDHDMNDEELAQYKLNKALVSVKMLGMLIALPGLAILIIAYK
jgi:hypothetical protein